MFFNAHNFDYSCDLTKVYFLCHINNEGTNHESKLKIIIATVASGVCLVLGMLLAFYCIRRKRRKHEGTLSILTKYLSTFG